MQSVKLEHYGQVALARLSRPEKLNALDTDGWGDLLDAIGGLRQSDVTALIVAGEGRGFCTGMDTAALGNAPSMRPILTGLVHPTIMTILGLGIPVISVVDGVAAGAGIGLALLADYRIGTSRTRFVAGFARQGLAPDAGSGLFMSRLLGQARASDFFLGGRDLLAEEARRYAVVNEIVSVETAEVRARHLAQEWAARGRETVRQTLELLRGVHGESLASYLQREADAQNHLTRLNRAVS